MTSYKSHLQTKMNFEICQQQTAIYKNQFSNKRL